MYCSSLSIIAIISLTVVVSTCLAQSLTYDERCQIIEGNGVRVDQCDGTKLLSCRDGRCQCPDPVNNVYTYRNEMVISSRSRRSPGKKGGGMKKGGGFKAAVGGAAVGAVAGAATYHVVNNAGKTFTAPTSPKSPKYRKVFSCYSRVGSQCALNYNNWESIDSGSTTTTTTSTTASPSTSTGSATSESTTSVTTPTSTSAAPSTSTGSATSESTTVSTTASLSTTNGSGSPSSTTTVAPQVSNPDISKIPRCVQYATCKPGSPTVGNNGTASPSGFMQKVDFDPRLGVCECDSGYTKTSRDLCMKAGSGA